MIIVAMIGLAILIGALGFAFSGQTINVMTLGGIAFLFHQVGSFLGVFIGGYLFDTSGSYNLMWILTIGMGVAAALIHWPIVEREIVRAVPKPA